MSTDIIEQGQVAGPHQASLAEFFGGADRGACVQITTSDSYVELTRDEVREVACEMLAWAGGNDAATREIVSRCRSRSAMLALSELSVIPQPIAGGRVMLWVYSLNQLHAIRQELRDCLGAWNDKHKMTWVSSGTLNAEFVGPEPYVIWLTMPPDDFPRELIGDQCHIVKQTTETISLQCDHGGDSNG